MSFTISFPFLYHFTGRGGVKTYHERVESGGGNLTHTKAKFREGGLPYSREKQVERMIENEVKFAGRRVSIAGEQFLCGGRAVSYQRAEEGERQENSILFDKVTTLPVCFKFVPNRGGGELHF